MKKLLIAIGIVTLALFMVSTSSMAKTATTTIKLLNPPKRGLLELAVGESYTFDILVESDEPFVLAIALGDEYYPGRGIFYHGNDTAHHTTSAILHLTMTGKEPTADLPDGVAPVGIVAGIRFKGGKVVSERFDFDVLVVP